MIEKEKNRAPGDGMAAVASGWINLPAYTSAASASVAEGNTPFQKGNVFLKGNVFFKEGNAPLWEDDV